MKAIFWITLLLDLASKIEFVGSQGLKNRKGKLFFFSLLLCGFILKSRLLMIGHFNGVKTFEQLVDAKI